VGGKGLNCFSHVRIRTPEPCPLGAGEAVPSPRRSQPTRGEGEIPLPPFVAFFEILTNSINMLHFFTEKDEDFFLKSTTKRGVEK
jgi:hypothetical protein